MDARLLLLAIAGFCPLWSTAQSTDTAAAPPPPAGLRAAMEQRSASLATQDEQAAKSSAALREWYLSGLDTLRKEAIAQGNLDHVLAVDEERGRADRDLTPAEREKLFYVLRELRYQFDRARAERATAMKSAREAATREYAGQLQDLENTLAQESNHEGAREVRRVRTVVVAPVVTSAIPFFQAAGAFEFPAPWYVGSPGHPDTFAAEHDRKALYDAVTKSPMVQAAAALLPHVYYHWVLRDGILYYESYCGSQPAAHGFTIATTPTPVSVSKASGTPAATSGSHTATTTSVVHPKPQTAVQKSVPAGGAARPAARPQSAPRPAVSGGAVISLK